MSQPRLALAAVLLALTFACSGPAHFLVPGGPDQVAVYEAGAKKLGCEIQGQNPQYPDQVLTTMCSGKKNIFSQVNGGGLFIGCFGSIEDEAACKAHLDALKAAAAP